MRARCVIAPAQHAAELRWLDAALATTAAPNWIAHWAATRIDVWRGVAAVAALLGDVELRGVLQAQVEAITVLFERGAAPIAVADVAAAVARVAQQLASYHRRAFATRDLCWAALTLAVQQDPAKRHEAVQVAAAVTGVACPRSLVVPFDDAARVILLAPVDAIEPSAITDCLTAPVSAYDAAAVAACSITVAQGYAMWRAALPTNSHTAQALDELLCYADVPGFPQHADIVAQGLDVALLRAAQLDAVADQLTAPIQGVAYRRALALTAALPACTSPTLVEIWVAARGLVDSVETVWWDVLGMVALAPLVAAIVHDAEPSERTAAELRAAAHLALDCFGHRDAWAEVLNAPPLHAALQRCFAQMQGHATAQPIAFGEVTFAGTGAACKASALRRLGELPPHPAAPSGWGDVTSWLAAMRDDVLVQMPQHGAARALQAWGQSVACAAVVQMQVATPPVRDLVLP